MKRARLPASPALNVKPQLAAVLLFALGVSAPAVEREISIATNAVIRVMAANLTGNSQKYEPNSIRIFQGLKPDIVAIQEFNYSNNTPAQIREMIDTAFGTNFSYFRESAYPIPNGVISRYPIRVSGSWDDAQIPDRGFAWAQLDIPGTNDLYVVSVHFKAGSSDLLTRSNEAVSLKNFVTANFPANAFIVVSGDMNLQTRGEAALTTLKTFLSDSPIPTDAESGGDPDTNEPRSHPYDVVLPSFSLATNLIPLAIGSRSFSNGLVFDSRVFTPLSSVTPVQFDDSGMNQHMAVLKDFRFQITITNVVDVPRPVLVEVGTNAIQWNSMPGIAYTVEHSVNLTNWSDAMEITAEGTNGTFTNILFSAPGHFYRVRF